MEAAETPSSHVLSTRGDEKTRDGEVVCKIVFEEYLSEWVKIATTRSGHLKGKESLDEAIRRPERFAARYGVSGSENDELVEEPRKIYKGTMNGPRRSKKHKSRQTRVEQMRRIYLLCRTPDTAAPPVPALKDSVHDAERRECWESEVDKLVAWTHSLSFEEPDRP
ncbi:uncharacterized protein LOC108267488 [Ictalurus punctatus]|uniref:Uncharacterized protein LOC108267488 n=1 Tax=Ictalurus punctatus TaxID=7998 RepID=A0A2D0R918_ICTPU|nr:uncharacterized protein LOC108267488 [Ictalurus punctatus]XP_053537132.1 uncharacterized protein LOC108267488 [Ictalurus punctatus]